MLPDAAKDELYYRLALTFVKDVGPVRAKKLIERFGTATEVFAASIKDLKQIDGINDARARAFRNDEVWAAADKELTFVKKYGVSVLWYEEDSYPHRLKSCSDAPLLMYYRGTAKLNEGKVIAVIGTRKYTDYGQRLTESLIKDLESEPGVLIVSGLAHGIDAIAHKQAVSNNVPTVGVLGHGLDRVYPAANKLLAKDMLLNGGLLSEFPSGTLPDRTNFPMRNRIVAGISDVTVVVESDVKGGAMITARVASSYNRDVAAFPGRVHDAKSSGCNELIRTNTAAMITNADDLLEMMNWKRDKKAKPVQKQLFIQLTEPEQKLINILQTKDSVHADELLHATGLSSSLLAATLLQLEMQDLVKALPGKHYRINF